MGHGGGGGGGVRGRKRKARKRLQRWREDGPMSLRCSLFYDAVGVGVDVGVVTGSKGLCYKQSQYQTWCDKGHDSQ